MRKLFLLVCLLAGALARPPQSHGDHEQNDHDHHYHHHDHYYHHDVDDDDHHDDDHGGHHVRSYPDPHDNPDHEETHFLRVHDGKNNEHGPYSGHGYHDSNEHYIKVYHREEVDSHHHDHHEHEEPDHEQHDEAHEEDLDDHEEEVDCPWHPWQYLGYGSDCGCNDGHDDVEDSKLLDELTHQAAKISDLLDNYLSPQDIFEKFAGLAEDINNIDHKATCAREGEYQCGGDDLQCVSKMLVCDGERDCPNGSDEDEYHCSVATTVGSHWKGSVVYDHCTSLKPKHIDLTIEDVHSPSWFTVQPQVTATAIIERNTSSSITYAHYEVHGHWSSSKRELYLRPPDTDGLALNCEFHGHDHDSCVGHVIREKTDVKCAEFIFRKVSTRVPAAGH